MNHLAEKRLYGNTIVIEELVLYDWNLFIDEYTAEIPHDVQHLLSVVSGRKSHLDTLQDKAYK